MLKEVVEENFNSDTADLTLTSPPHSTNNILTKSHTDTLLMNEDVERSEKCPIRIKYKASK